MRYVYVLHAFMFVHDIVLYSSGTEAWINTTHNNSDGNRNIGWREQVRFAPLYPTHLFRWFVDSDIGNELELLGQWPEAP